jgi:hypothetical protein
MRCLYIALHQGTSATPTAFSSSTADHDPVLLDKSSYPVCNIPGHHSHKNQPVISATSETTHPPSTTTSPTVPPPGAVLNSATPSAGPDVSRLPVLNPELGHIYHADQPSLNDVSQVTYIVQSSQSTPVGIENHHFLLLHPTRRPDLLHKVLQTLPPSRPWPTQSLSLVSPWQLQRS